MGNPSIAKLITGKTESEAIGILNQFKVPWRVMMRNGEANNLLSNDRDDRRYNLVLQDGLVERVLFG